MADEIEALLKKWLFGIEGLETQELPVDSEGRFCPADILRPLLAALRSPGAQDIATLTRYEMAVYDGYGDGLPCLETKVAKDGEWVRFEDVKALLGGSHAK